MTIKSRYQNITLRRQSRSVRRFVIRFYQSGASQRLYMVALAMIIGVVGGFGAIIFRRAIEYVQELPFLFASQGSIMAAADALPWWRLLVIPALGGLVVGPMVYFLAREAKGHGVPEVMDAVARLGGVIRPRVVAIKCLASAITIGTGGSAGREGPIVQIGSALGSALGQLLRLSGARLKTLVGCGAAAGIAATFNAPIAGSIFALEVILGDFRATTFGPIVVSSVIATAISRHYLGNAPAFNVPAYQLASGWEIPIYMVLGIVMGLVALAFTVTLYKFEDGAQRLARRLPEYALAPLGGLVVGAVGIFLPQLYGVGYEGIEQALLGRVPFLLLLVLSAAKIVATSITISSGGSGGIFAPSLFIGAMAGGTFGRLVHWLFPALTGASGAYALVGMGAVVAGATHAPITAILILFEMTGDYRIILPLMIACILATLVASQLNRESIYTMKLVRRIMSPGRNRETSTLHQLKVAEAMETENLETIPEDMSLRELKELMTNSRRSDFPLVDHEGMLTGIISLQDFRKLINQPELEDSMMARDLGTTEVITVTPEDTLDTALRKIGFRNITELPVVAVDDPRRIVGILTHRHIISAYNRALDTIPHTGE